MDWTGNSESPSRILHPNVGATRSSPSTPLTAHSIYALIIFPKLYSIDIFVTIHKAVFLPSPPSAFAEGGML